MSSSSICTESKTFIRSYALSGKNAWIWDQGWKQEWPSLVSLVVTRGGLSASHRCDSGLWRVRSAPAQRGYTSTCGIARGPFNDDHVCHLGTFYSVSPGTLQTRTGVSILAEVKHLILRREKSGCHGRARGGTCGAHLGFSRCVLPHP